ELELVGGVITRENYGVVLRQGEPELLAAVNAAIGRILADGRYERMYQRWIGEPLPANEIAALERVKGEGTPVEGAGAGGSALAIRWDQLRPALPRLLWGVLMTLQITFLTLLIGAPAGLL